MFIWTLGDVISLGILGLLVFIFLIRFLIAATQDFFEDRKKRKKDKEGE